MKSHACRIPTRLRLLATAGFVAVFAAAVWLTYLSARAAPPQIPVPVEMAKLEPQLRDYVSQKVAWVREKPRRADRHSALGLIYAVNGLWHEARQAFENAHLLHPKEPLAKMYIGVAAQELGNPDEAMNIFREVATRFPDFAPAHYRLGTALLRVGHVEEAEKAFGQLIALAPSEWRGYAGLGEVKLRRSAPAEAASLLEQAVQIDPSVKNAHHLLGQAYRALGRTEEAELELSLGRNAVHYPMPDEWSNTASEHVKLLSDQIQIANEFSDEGQPLKAVEILAKAFVYQPDNLGLMNQLAIALNRSSQPNKARKIIQRALHKDERYVPALITLAFCQEKLGEAEQALATATRAVELAPTIAQCHVAKANALLAMERHQEAIAALEAAARVDPQNAEIPLEIGDILWRNLRRPAEAQNQYETAKKLNPAFAPAYVRLAALQLELGKVSQARESLTKLRRIGPQMPDLAILESQLRKQESR